MRGALCILLVAFTCSGCATSGYFVDRGRDAADIFTASLGFGGGAKVRVGPIQPAAFETVDLIGLRGGHAFLDGRKLHSNKEWFAPIRLGHVTKKGKTRMSFGAEVYAPALDGTTFWRRKYVEAHSPFPCVAIGSTAAYYTQIEVAAGLLLTVRLGFNPGELLDFILGWMKIDIYHDDLEYMKSQGWRPPELADEDKPDLTEPRQEGRSRPPPSRSRYGPRR